jgi:hypothetical protein
MFWQCAYASGLDVGAMNVCFSVEGYTIGVPIEIRRVTLIDPSRFRMLVARSTARKTCTAVGEFNQPNTFDDRHTCRCPTDTNAVRSQHQTASGRQAVMNAATRLLSIFFVTLISVTSVATAPADPRSELPRTTLPLTPGDAGLLGTWVGRINVEGVRDAFDGGYISIERAPDERLAVSVGPTQAVRYVGMRLERTERGLRFEVVLPAAETRLLVYDVALDAGTMTGTVTFVKHRLTKPGQLVFVRAGSQ